MSVSPHSPGHPLDDEAWARVQDWVLGHGESAERSRFEEHLASCATCRLEADRAAHRLTALSLAAESTGEPASGLPEESASSRSSGASGETSSSAAGGRALWLRLKDRLGLESSASPSVQSWRSWLPDPGAQPQVIHASEDEFEPIGVPGITVRRLHVSRDQREVTMLVRMESGSSFPPHRHGGLERCLVLSGELHVGEKIARAGDYVGAEPGSLHPAQWTESGCELFITSSTSDELIDS